MALINKYKFQIQETTIGTVDVNPINSNIEFGYESGDIERIKKVLSSDIILTNADYQIIKGLEVTGVCQTINFYIDVYCSGAWVREFTGLIKIRKCKFNAHKCRVVLGVETNESAKCLNDISQEKVNIYDIPFHPAVYSFVGTIETITCTYATYTDVPISIPAHIFNNSCITAGQGWTLTENKIRNITAGSTSSLFNCECETTWKRQYVIGGTMPSGTGWIAIGLNWARAVTTFADPANSYGSYAAPLAGDIKEANTITPYFGTGTAETYDNGTYLNDALPYFVNLGGCTYTVISDFFGINPDATAPTNTAYTAAANYRRLVFWKNADVKRPNVVQNSTKMFITFEELFNELKTMFNVEMSVYETSGIKYVRIEHVSYFDNTNGLDLTAQWANVIKANEYIYLSDKLPSQEKFRFQSETDGQNGTFDGSPIMYDKNCTDAKTIVEFNASLSMTNFAAMLDNESVSDTGLAWAATELQNSQNFIRSTSELNDFMTWAKFQDQFYYYNRPFTSGTVNGVTKTFTLGRIKSEDVEVINYDGCSFHALNPVQLIKTKLGWGKVENMKYDAANGKLSLSLLH